MIMSAAICIYKHDELNLRQDTGLVMKRNFIFIAQAYVMSAIQFYLPLGVIHTIAQLSSISVSIYQYIF